MDWIPVNNVVFRNNVPTIKYIKLTMCVYNLYTIMYWLEDRLIASCCLWKQNRNLRLTCVHHPLIHAKRPTTSLSLSTTNKWTKRIISKRQWTGGKLFSGYINKPINAFGLLKCVLSTKIRLPNSQNDIPLSSHFIRHKYCTFDKTIIDL